MNGIIIGASSESLHAIELAKMLGMHIIAFDGDKNADGLRFADEPYVVDIRNPENIYSIIDEKHIGQKDMIAIPIPIGRYLISSGAFNDHYGLIGPNRKTTEICTDKWLFHQTLSKCGLRSNHCELLREGEKNCGYDHYPIIVKPRFGSGSRKVKEISSEEERLEFVHEMPLAEDFIIEDSVGGTEYGIDGMVLNGKFHMILVRKKINTSPPYRQCVGYISVNPLLDADLYQIFQKFIEKIVYAIELENGILHADIMYSGGEPFVIELSPRPSGHRLHDIFTPLVTGVDMVHEYLKYISTGNSALEPIRQKSVLMIRYFDIESKIHYIPDEKYLLNKYPILQYECNMKIGDFGKIVDGHSLMNRGFFIIEADSEDKVRTIGNDILSEFTETVI